MVRMLRFQASYNEVYNVIITGHIIGQNYFAPRFMLKCKIIFNASFSQKYTLVFGRELTKISLVYSINDHTNMNVLLI